MLISIVVPAFNAANTLAETIDSVIAQTVSNFELLIVDDGSTDATLAIASAYASRDPRVRTQHRANGGISAARNAALAVARGEWLALLDSDDLWAPDYLERQLAIVASHPTAAVVTANVHNLGGPWHGTPLWPTTTGVATVTLLDMIEKPDSICVMSLFRREVIDRIGGFNERLRSNEDYDFWLRAATAGFEFVKNFSSCGWYRRRPESVSADERKMLAGILVVLGSIRDACAVASPERTAAERQIQRFRRELLIADVKACLIAGELREAAELIEVFGRKQRRWTIGVAASIARHWPQSLELAYRCRQAVRGRRMALPPSAAALARPERGVAARASVQPG
jgi:hypothetical protein